MTRWVLLCGIGAVVGCSANKPVAPDAAVDATSGPACADGVDNDGDGTTDFPADLGCDGQADDTEDSVAGPICDDNRDNDGDGKTDFPDDPGCLLAQGDSEGDDCPSGPNCPQCGNGIDDNSNGLIDYPEEPGCAAASDGTEFLEDPVACGPGLAIEGLPTTGMDTGTFDGTSTSMLGTTCGGGGGASAIAYLFHLYEPKFLVATTDLPGTMVDTVLDLRGADCDDPAAEIACNDNIGTRQTSWIARSLAAGSYYLIVEGHDASELGSYALSVELLAVEGTTCATQAECGPGLVCRTALGASQMTCADPVCSDGVDDDADGKVDYPADPGCTGPADAAENDDCPNGPSCPECADGIDNDSDGLTDYPADTACAAASEDNESCTDEVDTIGAIISPTTTGTLVGASDDHAPSCSTGIGGADVLFTLEVPALQVLEIDTNMSGTADTVLSLLNGTCTQPSVACDDNGGVGSAAQINVGNLAAGKYLVAVDAFSSSTPLATFVVHFSGTVLPGESCEGALFQSGALVCSIGHACRGPIGSRTCSKTECNDGGDNNGDGKADYPQDPGCLSPSDLLEDTVCPGASCPVCSDGMDNDSDGFIDYPADPGCLAASFDDEG